MTRTKTLQDLFKRYRRPGDMALAAMSLGFALFLLVMLPSETAWVKRTKLFAQPAFWPGIAVAMMVIFSAMHLVGALVSERIPGRMAEMLYWLKALEYVVWFMAYVAIVPVVGYLLGSIGFCILLAWRLGYRGLRWALASAGFAVAVVVLFKSFLQVKIPAGAIYEGLPSGALRTFMMTYL